MLKGLKSVRKFYLKDSNPPRQQQRPPPVLSQDDSDYASSSGDERQASEPTGPYGARAAEAPMTPTHLKDGSSSEEEFDNQNSGKQLMMTRTTMSANILTQGMKEISKILKQGQENDPIKDN